MLRYILVLLLAFQITPLWAEETPAAQPDETTSAAVTNESALGEADHEALRRLLSDATAALNHLDSQALSTYLAPNFAVTLVDQRVLTSTAQLNDYFDKYFKGKSAPLKAVAFNPVATIKTVFIDGHTGVVYGTSTDHYTLADNSTLDIDSHWTATVVKRDGRWLVQTFHAGVNMLDNPILEKVRQANYLWGAIGLFIGLLLGALLMRALKRG